MAVDEKWYFTKEQLLQSPSRKSGYDVDKELSCRQQAANFIQDMGQRLQVSQLCINTAIVYMHRFYVFHSLAAFHRNAIAAAALFLAAKVEEQPRKLEHVIKVSHMCLHRENPNLDTKSEVYLEQAQDLVFNENVLLQTLGFDVAIDHPHTHVVRCCHLVRASKDLAQTSYFMASNSLHLTTMCLQYKPTVVACFCIHLACKWSNWEIPRSNEGKDWFWYIDKTVTIDLLEQLTAEFLAILDKCPTKLKRKMMSMNQNNTPGFTQQTVSHEGLQFEEPRKLTGSEAIKPPEGLFAVQKTNSQPSSTSSSSAAPPPAHAHHQKIDYREYREKKERERMEREKQQQQRDGHNASSSNHHHHHHHSKANVMPNKSHGSVQSRNSSGSVSHKSYQQPPPHGIQGNLHFQNLKENRDSNSQTFQFSSSSKDSNYLKQHPPHTERDGSKDSATFHGQYSQNSNMQHQSYPHKSESNYSGNYSHREGNRGSHGVQGSNNSSLPHHGLNQSITANSTNLANNQKDNLMGNQRDVAGVKDVESQSQSLVKDPISSSIRDIISQSVSQKDVHSMTNERKEHVRDKCRMNYIHSSTSNYRSQSVKSGRDQSGLNFHDGSTDRKMDEFGSKLKDKSLKKGEDEPVIDAIKMEPSHVKAEKFDEIETEDENGTWSLPNVKSEKCNVPVAIKSETISGKSEISVDLNKLDSDSNKSMQSMHSAKMYDSKYKTHHYHSSSKSSEVPQMKTDKPGAQCSSELIHKKISDRSHDKHRKVQQQQQQQQQQEFERISHSSDVLANSGDVSKHHKISKDVNEKSKNVLSGQQGDQRSKGKMSPSLYQKMKSIPRPSALGFAKSECGHVNADGNSNSNANACEAAIKSLKSTGFPDETNKNSTIVPQKQKSQQEFGNLGGSTGVHDTNAAKSSKTSSIFSPDSKIPPHNILTSLEKESKKSVCSGHRSHSSSNKTPPNAGKKSATGNMAASTSGSLFSPPLPKNAPSIPARHRTSSSGSEPELIPVLTKIDETPGYENIIRERKIDLTPTTENFSGSERERNEKSESGNAFLFASEQKNISSSTKTGLVKCDAIGQSVGSKAAVAASAAAAAANVKFSSEIRSDLGAVIYPKSLPKSSQGYSLADSVSTVNLLGIEKMVDTSISPAKQSNNQFGPVTAHVKHLGAVHFNAANSSANVFGSSSASDQTDKFVTDQSVAKANNVVSTNQESIDVDVLACPEKKKSEKKKKKEKHKRKEKDKDKSERRKEKKKHKDRDRERSREKERCRDQEKQKDKERHREKEIDVVGSEVPIKITIPKDKISGSLKLKISKDCLKKEEPDSLKSNTSGELKIKISKDVITGISAYKEDSTRNESSAKKRDRSPKSSCDLPHSKSMKTLEKKSGSSSAKSNGTEGGPSRNSSSHRYSISGGVKTLDVVGRTDLIAKLSQSQSSHQN